MAAGELAGRMKGAADRVGRGGNRVQHSPAYRWLAIGGLLSFGVVHLLTAWLAAEVALGAHGEACQQGALRTLTRDALGVVLLWLVAIGLFALTVWQATQSAVGYDYLSGARRTRKRLASAGRCVVYVVLGVSAVRLAVGVGSRSSDSAPRTLTSRLMGVPFGRVLVVLVAVGILAVGVQQVVRGVRRRFTDDLDRSVAKPVLVLGTVGYATKGVALAIVAGLFVWAAASYDPKKAGGLDAALKTIRDRPFGAALLGVTALGIACFGVYCFFWARHSRR